MTRITNFAKKDWMRIKICNFCNKKYEGSKYSKKCKNCYITPKRKGKGKANYPHKSIKSLNKTK